MGQLSDLIVLALSIGLVLVLFVLAWTLGVTAMLGVSRGRRQVRDAAGRVALLEREVRRRLRDTDARLIELEQAMRALDR